MMLRLYSPAIVLAAWAVFALIFDSSLAAVWLSAVTVTVILHIGEAKRRR